MTGSDWNSTSHGFISIYKMKTSEPEKKIREVVDACTDCDVCRHLMDKIRGIDPDRIVTECLSCRLQFNQFLPLPVSHPSEVLRDAYDCSRA
jgi:hypothetical protein